VTTFTASQVGAALWRSSPDASFFQSASCLSFVSNPAFARQSGRLLGILLPIDRSEHAGSRSRYGRPIPSSFSCHRSTPQLFARGVRCIRFSPLTLTISRQARGRSLRGGFRHGMSCRSQPRFRFDRLAIIIPESLVIAGGALVHRRKWCRASIISRAPGPDHVSLTDMLALAAAAGSFHVKSPRTKFVMVFVMVRVLPSFSTVSFFAPSLVHVDFGSALIQRPEVSLMQAFGHGASSAVPSRRMVGLGSSSIGSTWIRTRAVFALRAGRSRRTKGVSERTPRWREPCFAPV